MAWTKTHCLLIALALSLAPVMLRAAPKTDVIYLKNGDRVTGEIKSLLRSKLELKTDHMGTILIEWADIQEVVSQTSQVVELDDGARYFGPLEKPEKTDQVQIRTEDGSAFIESQDIVAMYPVEAGFWDRLDLSIELGFSWDKASSVSRSNLAVDAAWRDPRFITRGKFDTEITTQQDQASSRRVVLGVNHMRFLAGKKFRSVFGGGEQNRELGLELRALLGGGYGWIPVRNQRSLFALQAGLDVNREIPTNGDSQTNLELVGNLMYSYFFYSYPERHFDVNLTVFPSLTQGGRYRASLDASFKVEFFRDLFWGLSTYASYDNKPIAEGAATSDYGVTTSIGYNF